MPHAAYIYDAIRTPRSKGKKDGTLHEVKPVDLGAGLLRALQVRHDLDTSYVDDATFKYGDLFIKNITRNDPIFHDHNAIRIYLTTDIATYDQLR